MSDDIYLKLAIIVFVLLLIGIAVTIYEFTYAIIPEHKKKKKVK